MALQRAWCGERRHAIKREQQYYFFGIFYSSWAASDVNTGEPSASLFPRSLGHCSAQCPVTNTNVPRGIKVLTELSPGLRSPAEIDRSAFVNRAAAPTFPFELAGATAHAAGVPPWLLVEPPVPAQTGTIQSRLPLWNNNYCTSAPNVFTYKSPNSHSSQVLLEPSHQPQRAHRCIDSNN